MGFSFAAVRTVRGYRMDEVASALQKSIRRGLEEEALYWAAEIDRTGFGRYCWYRLQTIACEDIGLAEEAGFFSEIRALYEMWVETLAKKNDRKPERMFLSQAVLRLVRARKSELVGEALMAHWETDDVLYEIPDYALDPHTARGRRMGRRMPEFWDVTYHLENAGNVSGEDRYTQRCKKIESGAGSKATGSPTLTEKQLTVIAKGDETQPEAP